jgi:phosphonopyruvate decarboxylase
MKARTLLDEFKKHDVGPYIEVPCSILAPVISELLKDGTCEVINPVNEAIAMGLAAGSYMATRKVPVLMTQNSGLCNTLNAFTSLNAMYRIPALYLISWRGEPGKKDAPEHYIMGRKTKKMLDVLDIPYVVLSEKGYRKEIQKMIDTIKKTAKPAAIILRRGLLDKEKAPNVKSSGSIEKSKAVDVIMDAACGKAHFVTTNGFISREAFYSLNKKNIEKDSSPFYMLGSMGHALPIALGMSGRVNDGKKMMVLDGDGGCLMQMGAMVSVGKNKPEDLVHVVLDNGMYASTGGQPTISGDIDFCKIAKGCGYKNTYRITGVMELKRRFPEVLKKTGPTLVHILISSSEKKDRPRISEKYSCRQVKERFMERVRSDKRREK